MDEEKNRRMMLRRQIGNREVKPISESIDCKGPDYTMSYACFDCRKSFKRHFDCSPPEYPQVIDCLECDGKFVNLGRHFKAPRRTDEKQWKKVRYLVEHGFLFQKIRTGSGHHDTVPYPETLEEAKDFVIKYREYAIKAPVI